MGEERGPQKGHLDLATEDGPADSPGSKRDPGWSRVLWLGLLGPVSTTRLTAVAVENPQTGRVRSAFQRYGGGGQHISRWPVPSSFMSMQACWTRVPELEAFVQFYLEEATKLVPAVGYVALPQEAYTWAQGSGRHGRTAGSVFMDVAPGTPLRRRLRISFNSAARSELHFRRQEAPHESFSAGGAHHVSPCPVCCPCQ